MTDIIASSPNIQGNISNCEIQTIMVGTNYKPFKASITETYQVINKCDNTIISEYSKGNVGLGFMISCVLGLLVLIIIMAAIVDRD